MGRTKAATVDEKAQVIYLRALGLSSSVISERVGLSIRTVQRICQTEGVVKGELSEEILKEGRERLREHALNDEYVKDHIVTHLVDEMAQVRALREKSAAVLEEFNPKNNRERALFMRSAVAHSTILRNTSDIMRRAVDLDRFRGESVSEQLPELVFREMTEQEVELIRSQQRKEAAQLSYVEEDEAEPE